MPYYYVNLVYVSKLTKELKTCGCYDMSEETVLKSFVEPFMKGEEFMFIGRRIDPSLVESVNIYEYEESVKELADKSTYYGIDHFIGRILDHRMGVHVTGKFIASFPRAEKRTGRRPSKPSKSVFVVHGRDLKPLKELKAMLVGFGLSPIVLHEKPSGSRTIVEKLEKHSDVGYAFVILTPDDIGSSSDAPFTSPRARQNVILEFGYFIGKLERDRVCCLHKGDVELPSDMHGIVYIPFGESVNDIRDKIIKELTEAGYKVKM